MGSMFQMLGLTCWFITLFCYGFVVYKIFTEGESVIALVCGLGAFVCGLGMLAAFVYGWMRCNVWEIKPIMFAWTGFLIFGFLCNVLAILLGVEPAT